MPEEAAYFTHPSFFSHGRNPTRQKRTLSPSHGRGDRASARGSYLPAAPQLKGEDSWDLIPDTCSHSGWPHVPVHRGAMPRAPQGGSQEVVQLATASTRNWETVVEVPIAQLGDNARPPTATSNFKPEMEMGQGDASSAPFVKDTVSGLWKSRGKPRKGGQCG